MTFTGKFSSALDAAYQGVRGGLFSIAAFRRTIRLIFLLALLATIYWLLVASDRYVSESNVIIRKTDSVGVASLDIPMMVAGVPSVNRADQLLLREYLLSVDMLRKLDEKLDLRAHYSGSGHDLVSRMWFKDGSMEWFHRHYLSRTAVDYDDFAGVLRISAQAYDPATAKAIVSMLVQEGERYMNQIGHEMAQVQVSFLTDQVDEAQKRFQKASEALLSFQNAKGLVSPQATAESISVIVGKLEEQRSQLQTQLASLPKNLARDHPNILMLTQSIQALDKQISQERARLASPTGQTLNYTVEQFHRLEMEVAFAQDMYKAALAGLEKGRMDATRMLEKVSVLQAPTLPEYPLEPRRLYNIVVTLLVALLIVGILKLLESIVLDHVD
ncbi:hypothetical protein LMG26689_01781 [Achromobacter animicus]|uniref:chain-length determining protein n=1 Tax=Achromobacter TaxID=222 RepID=UPI00146565E1|nr:MULTISPECIES: chain-length determining protein [Achromobacter]CAB3847138.1 hypothetical protein LMG26689_01781 [Achromobacter animicus]